MLAFLTVLPLLSLSSILDLAGLIAVVLVVILVWRSWRYWRKKKNGFVRTADAPYSHDWLITSSFIVDEFAERIPLHIATTKGDLSALVADAKLPPASEDTRISIHGLSLNELFEMRDGLGIQSWRQIQHAENLPDKRPTSNGEVPAERNNQYLRIDDPNAALRIFFFLSLADEGIQPSSIARISDYVYSGIALPILGSPPTALKTIAEYAATVAPGAAIIASGGLDGIGPARIAIGLGSQIFWIYYGKPLMMVTSEAWERWLCRRLKVSRKSLEPDDHKMSLTDKVD